MPLSQDDREFIRRQMDPLFDEIRSLRDLIRQEAKETQVDLTNITQAVTDNTTVEEGAITLLGQLSDLVRGTAGDQQAVNDLANKLDSEKSNLAAALVANTPAASAGGGGTPAFVAKVANETYQDYLNRAQAAGVTPADEATWDALPVG